MKNQNPQEILNEILLRMSYDMTKTLSENKEFLSEQPVPGLTSSTQAISNPAGYYYLPDGSLTFSMSKPNMFAVPLDYYIKVNGLKKTNNYYIVPKSINTTTQSSLQNTYSASQNLKPNPNYIYTKQERIEKQKEDEEKAKEDAKAQFNKTIKLNPNWGKPRKGQTSPEDYVPMYYPSYMWKDEIRDYSNWYLNYSEVAPWQKNIIEETKPKTITEIKAFQVFLNEKYPTWYQGSFLPLDSKYHGTFGENSKKMWGDAKVRENWYKQKEKYISLIKTSEAMGNYKPPAVFTPTNYSIVPSSEKTTREKLSRDLIDVPKYFRKGGNMYTVVEDFWKSEDFKDLDTFKKGIIDRDGSASTVYFMGKDYFSRTYGKKYLKSFTIKPEPGSKESDIVFKQVIENGQLGNFGTLDSDGDLIFYDKWTLIAKTGWEEWGPFLLNVGSIAISVAFPISWPLLLVSAGLDVAAATMQYQQGETEGAKLSLLLALVPFIGKIAFKVPKSVSARLMAKFANAKTEADILRILPKLSKDELKALKTLREFGDLGSEIKKLKTSSEVAKAINKTAKEAPGMSKILGLKIATEIGGSGTLLYSFWDDIREEVRASQTRLQLFNGLFKKIKNNVNLNAFPSLTSEDLKLFTESFKEDIDMNEFMNKAEALSKAMEKAENDLTNKKVNESLIWLDNLGEVQPGTEEDLEKLKDTISSINDFTKKMIDKKLNPNEKVTEEEKNKLK